MGESAAFLTRSFSHPSPNSAESREKDPINGALTSSISLGRYMSETLAWDKWSVFNQNRYIEEAERYSKPGSVAAKKAYFEAHYKNLAAKKAAALLEQQCPAVDNVSSGNKMNVNDDNNSVETSRKNLPQESHTEGSLTEKAEVAIGRPPFTEKNVNQQIDVESHDVQGMQAIKNVPTLGVSVAEKKSFLEAHFKKIAAEKATAVENCSLGNSTNENDDKSASQLELAREGSEGTKISKMYGESTLNTGALLSVDANQQTLPEEKGLQGTQTEELEQSVEQPPFTEKDVKPFSNQMDVDTHDEQKVKPLLENAPTFEDSASMDKNEDAFSSGKPSTNDGGSNSRSSVRPNARVSRRKLDHPENSTPKKRSNLSSEKLRSTQSLEKKRSTQSLEKKRSARGRSLSTEKDTKPLHNCHHVDLVGKATIENPSSSGASVTSVKNEDACSSRKASSNSHGSKLISSIKPNIPTGSRKLDHPVHPDIPISKKRLTQSLEKRRPSVQALHMSMNFTSHTFEASKTSSPVSKKIVDSRLHKPNVRTSSAVTSSPQTLLKASVGGKTHLRVTPELGNGRTKTLRDLPVSESISGTNNKSNSSLQDGKPKPACQSKGKSTTLSQSFCLRSDERAAKRKEYFEKLEQQKLSLETEKELCKSKQKEKAKGRLNALHQSVPSLAEAKSNFHSSTISASIATRKLPTQSYFQQTKRRLASEAQDNNSRPPWRLSKKTDSFGDVAEKNHCTKVTATPMKTKSENTCPNIPLSTHKLAPKTTLFAS